MPGLACGIAKVAIDGLDMTASGSWLWRDHRVVVTPIAHDEYAGLRVSPIVYSTAEELDRVVHAVEYAMARGIPAPA